MDLNWALVLIDIALLAWAGWVAVQVLNRRASPALGLVLVAILASVVPLYLGAGDGAVLRFAAAVVAAATARRQRGWSGHEIPDVFPGLERTRAWEPVIVGVLAGLVVAGHPAYLLLGVGIVLMLEDRARRSVAVIAMALSALGLSFLPQPIGGGWQGALATLDISPGSEVLWAGLEFSLGGTFGVLPWFVPVILLLALHQFRGAGAPVVWGGALSCATLIVLWPLDWLPSAARLGSGWFLPVYGAMFLTPARPARKWQLTVTALVAAVFLVPHWWGLLPGVEGMAMHQTTPVTRFLPVETTPSAAVGPRFSVGVIDAWSPDLDTDRGAWLIEGGEWGTLVVTSRLPVERVWLDCGGQAGTDIEVRGAEAGEIMFRADGGVGFALQLSGARRHVTAFDADPVHVHTVRFRLPAAPDAPIRVRLQEHMFPGANQAGS